MPQDLKFPQSLHRSSNGNSCVHATGISMGSSFTIISQIFSSNQLCSLATHNTQQCPKNERPWREAVKTKWFPYRDKGTIQSSPFVKRLSHSKWCGVFEGFQKIEQRIKNRFYCCFIQFPPPQWLLILFPIAHSHCNLEPMTGEEMESSAPRLHQTSLIWR